MSVGAKAVQLANLTIVALAEFICGGPGGRPETGPFPYRTSSELTRFFRLCDLDYAHDGSTRTAWVEWVLRELNEAPQAYPGLPSDELMRVIQELLDPKYFGRAGTDYAKAVDQAKRAVQKSGLDLYQDDRSVWRLRNDETHATSEMVRVQDRPMTPKESKRRRLLEEYLQSASEEDLTTNVLLPLFRQLGFVRVSPAGHRDRALEFGKDVWMKYRLPTAHWIYFGLQIKKHRLDASGDKPSSNVANILTQVEMMLRDPIFDPDTNIRNLVDHVFIISGGEITKQAKNFLGQQLDQTHRRHILFLDRDQLLDLAVLANLAVPGDQSAVDNVPF
ncbi:MAG: hypothetical protein ACP5QO_13020 [Clostridia bacterium]